MVIIISIKFLKSRLPKVKPTIIIFSNKFSVLSRALQPPENTSVASFTFDSDTPKFEAKNHNYTDCCVASNVTSTCLGFCNIQSILEGNTGQDPENCETDFPEIVKCMAGEKKKRIKGQRSLKFIGLLIGS